MRKRMMWTMAGAALALPACHKAQQQTQPADQNLVIGNDVTANADVEQLPADESDATPSNQLANGSDNADVDDDTDNEE